MESELSKIISGIDFENINKHPNILIAARFWDDKRYHAAKVCYKFMRMIDDYIDDRKSKEDAIGCLEAQMLTEKVNNWIECLVNTPENDPFIEELTEIITTYKIPLQLFHNFAKSMLFDINHTGFSSFDEFIEYSEGASVAPASVFVHLCCLNEKNGEYIAPDFDVIKSARPCALFSYIVHIIRDFQEDQQSNLNYFATDILEKYGLRPEDLKAIANGDPLPDSFRNVIAEYHAHARRYSEDTLQEIENMSALLEDRNLMSLKVIYGLYKMVFDRIDIEKGSFTTKEMNPSAREIKEKVFEIALKQ